MGSGLMSKSKKQDLTPLICRNRLLMKDSGKPLYLLI